MRKIDIIAPSILSANFARLGEEVDAVIQAGAGWIHFDVMDNHYVPNLTIGAMVCQALKKEGVSVPIDVHLMVKPVDALIEAFAKAGADYITFHPDASDDVTKSIALIKSHGVKAGLALNPDVPIDVVLPFLGELDLVLLMSVFPGFGGQAFIPSVLDKITAMRSHIETQPHPIALSVDGGINQNTIFDVAKAGADTFVAGAAIFNSDNYQNTISTLKNTIDQAKQS